MISNYNGKYYNLKDKEFFIVPLPKEDEQLSSWLVRTAYKHQITPSSFISFYLPREYFNKFWERDIDIKADEKLLSILHKKSFLKKESLYSLTLKSYEGYLNEKIVSTTRNNLILPLGNRARYKFLNGQKICPLCAREKEPYFKKSWRLSFNTVCVKHKTLFVSKCPNCLSSLTIAKMHNAELDFTHCQNCGFDFKSIEGEKVKDTLYIEKLMDILEKGIVIIDDTPIYSILYFMMLKQVTKLICSLWEKKKYESEYFFVNKYSNNKYNLEEKFSTLELYFIYKDAFEILNKKRSFYFFCKKYKFSKSVIFKDMKYIPFLYESLFDFG